MTGPDYPRLVKVLAEAWAAPAAGIDIDDSLARELIEGIPPTIADRLEAALDVCGFVGCVAPKDDPRHRLPDPMVGARRSRHMYVPLVQP